MKGAMVIAANAPLQAVWWPMRPTTLAAFEYLRPCAMSQSSFSCADRERKRVGVNLPLWRLRNPIGRQFNELQKHPPFWPPARDNTVKGSGAAKALFRSHVICANFQHHLRVCFFVNDRKNCFYRFLPEPDSSVARRHRGYV